MYQHRHSESLEKLWTHFVYVWLVGPVIVKHWQSFSFCFNSVGVSLLTPEILPEDYRPGPDHTYAKPTRTHTTGCQAKDTGNINLCVCVCVRVPPPLSLSLFLSHSQWVSLTLSLSQQQQKKKKLFMTYRCQKYNKPCAVKEKIVKKGTEKLADKKQTNLIFQNKRCDAKNGCLGREWTNVILIDFIFFNFQ